VNVLRGALAYFAIVFGIGFLLGAMRVPLLVPRIGAAAAELLELPLMLIAIVLVARWRQRKSPDLDAAQQLVVGIVAFWLMLGAECALGAVLQGRTPVAVLLAHDPLPGTLYYLSLAVFALLPWWWTRRASAARMRLAPPRPPA
jgi:hypothetical protein